MTPDGRLDLSEIKTEVEDSLELPLTLSPKVMLNPVNAPQQVGTITLAPASSSTQAVIDMKQSRSTYEQLLSAMSRAGTLSQAVSHAMISHSVPQQSQSMSQSVAQHSQMTSLSAVHHSQISQQAGRHGQMTLPSAAHHGRIMSQQAAYQQQMMSQSATQHGCMTSVQAAHQHVISQSVSHQNLLASQPPAYLGQNRSMSGVASQQQLRSHTHHGNQPKTDPGQGVDVGIAELSPIKNVLAQSGHVLMATGINQNMLILPSTSLVQEQVSPPVIKGHAVVGRSDSVVTSGGSASISFLPAASVQSQPATGQQPQTEPHIKTPTEHHQSHAEPSSQHAVPYVSGTPNPGVKTKGGPLKSKQKGVPAQQRGIPTLEKGMPTQLEMEQIARLWQKEETPERRSKREPKVTSKYKEFMDEYESASKYQTLMQGS